MELIAAVLFAGPLGYFAKSRKQGLMLYLMLWAVLLPIQTIVVFNAQDGDWMYWAVNAFILAVGIGLNRLGAKLSERRRPRERPLPTAAHPPSVP